MNEAAMPLTGTDVILIRMGLREQYERAIGFLDLHDPDSFWLRRAGQAWDAYTHFAGFTPEGELRI